MTDIPANQPRNNMRDVLRRAASGEHLTVTVAGRPVASLGRTRTREWVSAAGMAAVWQTTPPRTLQEDLKVFAHGSVDPFGE